MAYNFFPTNALCGRKHKTMYSNISPAIVQLVANAQDTSPEKLLKNQKLCVLLTELFETSPQSGRNQYSMLTARFSLFDLLVGTTRRAEVYSFIKGNPQVAEVLLAQLTDVQKKLEELKSRCKNALESGNS